MADNYELEDISQNPSSATLENELPKSESNSSVLSTTGLTIQVGSSPSQQSPASSPELSRTNDHILTLTSASDNNIPKSPSTNSNDPFLRWYNKWFPLGVTGEMQLQQKLAYLLVKIHIFSLMCLIAVGMYLLAFKVTK